MSSGENSRQALHQPELNFPLSEQVHLQPQHKLQQQHWQPQRGQLQYPAENPHDARSCQAQQERLLRRQEESHLRQQQQQQFLKQREETRREQHRLQEQWQIQKLWKRGQQNCGMLQGQLPASTEQQQQQQQQLPSPLQEQQHSLLIFPESSAKSRLFSVEDLLDKPALEQRQAEKQRQTSWQPQHEVSKWRQQQEQLDRMPQLRHQQQYQLQQPHPGDSSLGQQQAWEPGGLHFSAPPQECQPATVSQQHQRALHRQDLSSVQHHQQEAASEFHVQQRQPWSLTCMPQPPQGHSLRQEQQQQPCNTQQQLLLPQQSCGIWQERQELQQRQQEFDTEQQQNHDKACLQPDLLAAASAHITKEVSEQRQQRLSCDMVGAANMSATPSPRYDWVTFAPKQEQQQQQQHESGIKQHQQPKQCLVVLQQQHHCRDPIEQKQLLLSVSRTEPPFLLKSCEWQQPVLKQQATLKQLIAPQQRPALQKQTRETLFEKELFSAAGAAASSAGSGEAPVSPRVVSGAAVVVFDSQEVHLRQQQQQEVEKQLLLQDVYTQQAYLYSEQQQKLQLQPLVLEEEQQQQVQPQEEVLGKRSQQHVESAQLQQQQHSQQQQGEQQLRRKQHKGLEDGCNAQELLDKLCTSEANVGVPWRGTVAYEQCQKVHLLSTADSLTAPAGDGNLSSGKDMWQCVDSSGARTSVYTQYQSGALAATATDMTFSSEIVESRNQSASRCGYNDAYNNNSSGGCKRGSDHQQRKFSISSDAKTGSLASGDVSSGCSGRESDDGRINCRNGKTKGSRKGVNKNYSEATSCVGVVSFESSSTSSACVAPSEAALHHASSSSHNPKFTADSSGGSRRGREQPTEISHVLRSYEEDVHSSRKGISRSKRGTQSSGWQTRGTNSRGGRCVRCSGKCETGQITSYSNSMESNQCCSSRRHRRSRTRISNTSGHSRRASFISRRSNEHSSSERSTNSRYGIIRDRSIEEANIIHAPYDTERSRSHTSSNSESDSSSPGEKTELLVYSESRRGRRRETMNDKEAFNSSRRRRSSSNRERDPRGSGRKCNEINEDTSGGNNKATIVMRNFNMLVDVLSEEDDREGGTFALRVAEEPRCLPKLAQQRGQRYHQQQQHEEQQHHQQQHRYEQVQWMPEVHRQSQQSEDLLVGRSIPYSSDGGAWQNESIALEVLDQHARLSSSPMESGDAGSNCSTLLRLPGIESKSGDSHFLEGVKRSNSGSRKNSCTSSRDDVAYSNSKKIDCFHQMKRSETNSCSDCKGDATCGIRRQGRDISCSGAGEEECFAGRRLHDMKPDLTATTGCPDTKHKHSRRSSSGSRRTGGRRFLSENTNEICFDIVSGAENGCTSSTRNTFQAVQQQNNSSSRTADEAVCTTHRRRRASRSCVSGSPKQQNDVISTSKGWNSSDMPLTDSHFPTKGELRNTKVRNSSCSSSCAVLQQQQQQRGARHIRFNSEAQEESKLNRLKWWAIETLDVLPRAWIGEQIDAVATVRQRGSPAYPRSSSSHPDISTRLLSKKNRHRSCVRVNNEGAETATSPCTQPATRMLDVTASAADAAQGESRRVGDTGTVATAAAGSPEAAPRELSSAAWGARTCGGAAPAASTRRPGDPMTEPAAQAKDMRETMYVLQGYAKDGDVSAAAARIARQATVKAAIRQLLLQQYSSMLQQLQQHKAAAQLAQDESEPLRAALVHVVAAEAQLRKLQRSERWRVHVGALIHDADDDLVKFMANFGSAADNLPIPVDKKETASLVHNGDRRRRRKNVFSSDEQVLVEEEQEDEESGETTEEALGQADEEEPSLCGLMWICTPVIRLFVRNSSSNNACSMTSCSNGRKTRKNGSEPRPMDRSRVRLFLRFLIGYIVLCGIVFLWLRHSVHQL